MNKSSFIIGKPVFKVDEENRVVICTITIGERVFYPDYSSNVVSDAMSKLGYPYRKMRCIGIAKCRREDINAPADKWDETLGRKLAESRARRKVYKTINKIAAKVNSMMQKTIEENERYMAKNSHIIKTEENYIKNLI